MGAPKNANDSTGLRLCSGSERVGASVLSCWLQRLARALEVMCPEGIGDG